MTRFRAAAYVAPMLPRAASLLAAALALILCACTEQRSRAVNEPAAGKGGKGGKVDFQAMIERSRNRQHTQDTVQTMQQAIRRFHSEIGRVPTNLAELVNRRYIPRIPQLPAGQQFAYDPTLGFLQIATVRTPDPLVPELPPAPPLTNRATLSPLPKL